MCDLYFKVSYNILNLTDSLGTNNNTLMERQIARIETKLESIENEVRDIKSSVKSDYQTKEGATSCRAMVEGLHQRIVKIESNLSKVVWIVLTAVISAILYLIFK